MPDDSGGPVLEFAAAVVIWLSGRERKWREERKLSRLPVYMARDARLQPVPPPRSAAAGFLLRPEISTAEKPVLVTQVEVLVLAVRMDEGRPDCFYGGVGEKFTPRSSVVEATCASEFS